MLEMVNLISTEIHFKGGTGYVFLEWKMNELIF